MRRSIFVSMLWLVLALNPASAFSWEITNISPNPVQYGCVVTLAGSFENQGNNTVRFWANGGQKYVLPIKSWSGSAIKVDTGGMTSGYMGIGIFSGVGTQLAKSAKPLLVGPGPCTGSSSKPSILPKLGFGSGVQLQAPKKSTGAVAPKVRDDRAATKLAVPPKINPKLGTGSGAQVPKLPKVNPTLGLGSGIQAPKKVKSDVAVELALTPMVQQVRSSDGDLIKPGVQVRIKGTGFGKLKGKVFFRVPGFQDTPRELYNVGWVSGFEVLGSIPSDLSSKAQVHARAEYKVISSKGRQSVWFKPSFQVGIRPATRFATQPMIRQVTAPGGIALGKDFIIEGMGFGRQPGKITIWLNDDPANYAVQNVRWDSPVKIRGTIPQSLGKGNGIKDMELSFRVTKHDGQKSGKYKVALDSTVEMLLPLQAVTGYGCGASDYDICGVTGTPNTVSWRMNKHSVRGYHRQNLGHIGNDNGYDIHLIRLDNGWVISRVAHKFTKSSGDESISPSLSHSALVGKNEADLRVDWSVSPDDNLMYEYKIWIKGPIGLPFKCKGNLPFCDSSNAYDY
jgi:hypothetical protein